MAVHNPKTHQDLEDLDETQLFQDLEAQSTFTPAERSSLPQAAFSHLVSGYNSGYYAYVWYVTTPALILTLYLIIFLLQFECIWRGDIPIQFRRGPDQHRGVEQVPASDTRVWRE